MNQCLGPCQSGNGKIPPMEIASEVSSTASMPVSVLPTWITSPGRRIEVRLEVRNLTSSSQPQVASTYGPRVGTVQLEEEIAIARERGPKLLSVTGPNSDHGVSRQVSN